MSSRAPTEPESGTDATGRFVWYDLMTPDVETARSFYAGVVGWDVRAWEGDEEPYYIWMAGESPVGGLMGLPDALREQGVPTHWMGYVAVADVGDVVTRARRLGGSVVRPVADIPGVGRFAILADPQGAVFSILEPLEGGISVPDRWRAGSVTWHELYTPNGEGAWLFYSTLFGWKHAGTMDLDDTGPYLMFRHPEDAGDDPMGALFDPGQDRLQPAWGFYFRVGDLDAAVERIVRGGGTVLSGPMDVPDGGRISQAADPLGGYFALFAER